jgi:hypothetical protein
MTPIFLPMVLLQVAVTSGLQMGDENEGIVVGGQYFSSVDAYHAWKTNAQVRQDYLNNEERMVQRFREQAQEQDRNDRYEQQRLEVNGRIEQKQAKIRDQERKNRESDDKIQAALQRDTAGAKYRTGSPASDIARIRAAAQGDRGDPLAGTAFSQANMAQERNRRLQEAQERMELQQQQQQQQQEQQKQQKQGGVMGFFGLGS